MVVKVTASDSSKSNTAIFYSKDSGESIPLPKAQFSLWLSKITSQNNKSNIVVRANATSVEGYYLMECHETVSIIYEIA